MDDYPLLSAYLRPHPALDRRTHRRSDFWRGSLGKLHLWRGFDFAGREPAPPPRIYLLDRQGGQWRAQLDIRSRQQRVVDNLYADLSVQNLLRPRGVFSRRHQQHHPRPSVRPERHKHDPDPRHARGGRSVLSAQFPSASTHSQDAQNSRPDDSSGPTAVFAVFVRNYQPTTSRSPRKSWTASGSAIGKTAGSHAVSPVSVVEIQEVHKRHPRSALVWVGGVRHHMSRS